MEIAHAQADLRRAYTDGGPGVIVSGAVWLAAALAEANAGVATGFAVLFFGGMLIYPLGLLINRVLLRRAGEGGGEAGGNPGGTLVLEATVAMIGGLIAAWLFVDYRPEWVMPLAAIMVGTHYGAFRSAYGMKEFYLLAAAITLVGTAGVFRFVPLPVSPAWAVAVIELLAGAAITLRALRRG